MDDCCSYTALGDEAGAAFARTAPSGVYAEKARGRVPSVGGHRGARASGTSRAHPRGHAGGEDACRAQERDGTAGAEASGHGDSQTS